MSLARMMTRRKILKVSLPVDMSVVPNIYIYIDFFLSRLRSHKSLLCPGHEIMVNEGSERWFSKALKRLARINMIRFPKSVKSDLQALVLPRDTQVVGYCGGLLLCFSNDSLEKAKSSKGLDFKHATNSS